MSHQQVFQQFQELLDQNVETITKLTDVLLSGDLLTQEEIKELILKNHKELASTPKFENSASPRNNRSSTEEQLKLLKEEIGKLSITKEHKETQTEHTQDPATGSSKLPNKENSSVFAVKRFQPQFRAPVIGTWK